MVDKIVFDEQETAAYLGISRSTLRQGRMNGRRSNRMSTPTFIKIGRSIRYLKTDLDAFLQKFRVEKIG